MAMGGTMKSPRASEAGRIMSPGSSFKNSNDNELEVVVYPL